MTKKTEMKVLEDQKTLVDEKGNETKFDSKSALMKHLYDEHEMDVGAIAKLVGVRYQFVNNVLDAHTNGNIRRKQSGPSKSDLFRKDYDDGMKVGEIAKKHNANYTFVHTTIKKYVQTKAPVEAQKPEKATAPVKTS